MAILLLILCFVVTESFADCLWTSCQPDIWAEKGCEQYNREEYAGEKCSLSGDKGFKYYCCRRHNITFDFSVPGVIGYPDFVSYNQFTTALTSNNYPLPSYTQYINFNKWAHSQGNISSVQEAAMCLAQFIYESDGLRAIIESACVVNYCPNAYRTADCDAPNRYYYGRGYLQLTWCRNYEEASTAIFGDNRLVNDPDLVARNDSVAWRTAFWYWGKEIHNAPGVALGRFGVTTKGVNRLECVLPGQPGNEKRFKIYEKVRAAFGLIGPGDPSGCS